MIPCAAGRERLRQAVRGGERGDVPRPRDAGRTIAATVNCTRPLTTFAPTITRLRGRRSAQTPPARMKTSWLTVKQASTTPMSEAPPPISRIANASATYEKDAPRREIVRPAKNSRKSRSRSGARAPRSQFERITRTYSDAPRRSTRRRPNGRDRARSPGKRRRAYLREDEQPAACRPPSCLTPDRLCYFRRIRRREHS